QSKYDDFTALRESLLFQEQGSVRIASYGAGKVVLSENLSKLMQYSDVASESLYSQGFRSIRRVKDDGNFYYFITNPDDKSRKEWVALETTYRSAAIYNPMTGTAGYAQSRDVNGRTEIYLELNPGESLVVETFKGK